MEQMFNVSSNPHVRARMTTAKIMQLVVIALLPAALMGIYNHGLKALAVLVVSTGSAALAEWLYDHFMHKKNTVKDFSAVVTGLLIGLNMPAGIPLWIPVLGSIFCNYCGKTAFWRSWTELYKSGPGSPLFPYDFLCRQDDRFFCIRQL